MGAPRATPVGAGKGGRGRQELSPSSSLTGQRLVESCAISEKRKTDGPCLGTPCELTPGRGQTLGSGLAPETNDGI